MSLDGKHIVDVTSNPKILQHNLLDGYHVAGEKRCCYYITRKQRGCRRRASDGSQFCSLHEPSALAAERLRCRLPAPTGPVPSAAEDPDSDRASEGQTTESADAVATALSRQCAVTGSERRKKTRLSGWRRRKQRAAAAAEAAATGRVSSTSRRMRNPLSCSGGGGAPEGEMPRWDRLLGDPSLPVVIDVGSARGLFVEGMAREFPGANYVGVEIREQFVEEALARTADLRARAGCNLAYLAANVLAGSTMADLLSSLAAAGLQVSVVAFQFPDPWVSPKHRKRRTVSPRVAEALAAHLPVGGQVYVSSDVPAVLWDAARTLGATGALAWHRGPGRDPPADEEGLLLACPLGGGRVFSERDRVCEDLWRRVYRVLFVKEAPWDPATACPAADAPRDPSDPAALEGYAADGATTADDVDLFAEESQNSDGLP